jgi:glycosyltransferase involved in cell wall biosynthesis
MTPMTPMTTMATQGSAEPPLVSVIVATYNSRTTLACALDSVRRQDFQDFEVWVVGDACTDDSHEIVEAIGDARFHWINRETNFGSQSAPNADGLRQAGGRYVAYLGHDDLWFPWHLSTLVAAIERDSTGSVPGVGLAERAGFPEGAGFAHGLGVLLGPDDRLEVTGPPPRGASYARHFVPPTNWLHRRDLLDRVGGWQGPDRLAWPVDVDVIRRIAASGAVITSVSRLTTIKFPSGWWKLYARDSPRPQLAMRDEMLRDPAGLADRLLNAIATEYARTRYPMRATRPSDALREAAGHACRAIGTWVHGFDDAPIAAPLMRWHFQRLRRKARRQRGLS